MEWLPERGLPLEVAEHVVAVAQLAQRAARAAVGQPGELAGLQLIRRCQNHAVAEGLLRGLAAGVGAVGAPVFDPRARILLGQGMAVDRIKLPLASYRARHPQRRHMDERAPRVAKAKRPYNRRCCNVSA